MGERGRGELRPKENCSPRGPPGPEGAGVLCGVVVRAQVGGSDARACGKGRGPWEPSRPVSEGNCPPVRWHCAVTPPPLRTPAGCPLLPPPVFGLGRAVVFSFGRPRSLRCCHSAGLSPTPYQRRPRTPPRRLARPAPPSLLSAVLFCLEAKRWLELELDPFTFPSLRSRWRSGGWDARAGLLGATALAAEDRSAAAAGSKCGSLHIPSFELEGMLLYFYTAGFKKTCSV